MFSSKTALAIYNEPLPKTEKKGPKRQKGETRNNVHAFQDALLGPSLLHPKEHDGLGRARCIRASVTDQDEYDGLGRV